MALPMMEMAMEGRERAKEMAVMAIPMPGIAKDERERAKKMAAMAIPMTEIVMEERERAMEMVKKAVLPRTSGWFVTATVRENRNGRTRNYYTTLWKSLNFKHK